MSSLKFYFILLKRFIKFFVEMLYAIVFFKNVKVFLCNHFTVGIKYLHKQKATFPHPVGIVIGLKVKLGYNCTIFQNVTIGTKLTNGDPNALYPILGNNVTIYPNSVLFGDITIGDNVIIGAGSVVFKDIPANSIIGGNPARDLKSKS